MKSTYREIYKDYIADVPAFAEKYVIPVWAFLVFSATIAGGITCGRLTYNKVGDWDWYPFFQWLFGIIAGVIGCVVSFLGSLILSVPAAVAGIVLVFIGTALAAAFKYFNQPIVAAPPIVHQDPVSPKPDPAPASAPERTPAQTRPSAKHEETARRQWDELCAYMARLAVELRRIEADRREVVRFEELTEGITAAGRISIEQCEWDYLLQIVACAREELAQYAHVDRSFAEFNLPVSTEITVAALKKIYLRLAKQYHPDVGSTPDAAKMARLNVANACLQKFCTQQGASV